MTRLRLPPPHARPFLVVAVSVWLGVGIGWFLGLLPAIGALGIGLLGRRRPTPLLIAGALTAGMVSGWGASARQSAVLEMDLGSGGVTVSARVVEDPRSSVVGWRTLVDPFGIGSSKGFEAWDGPLVVVLTDDWPDVSAGERVTVSGYLDSRPGFFRGTPYAGRIRSGRILAQMGAADPLFGAGNRLRDHILERLGGGDEGRALLAGFLVGETSGVEEIDQEALRRSGLSHYVAVSGSNVALFLGLWAVVLGPLGWGPRRRGVLGLVGLALFVVITRWEPSVVRASAMAGLILAYRALGRTMDAWTALGVAVTGCLLVSGDLAFDVGFQLSVAATAGVMLGSAVWRFKPKAVSVALGASLAAQIAVAPILLARFGSIPLFSPAVNVLAAPLVTAATAVGGVGALLAFDPLVGLGGRLAWCVLWLGREAAGLPQIGWVATMVLAICVGLLVVVPSRRLVLVTGLLILIGVTMVRTVHPPEVGVVFLDVGQGDAALVFDRGVVILVDGGPNPLVLDRALRKYGVGKIDLVVATHVHEDHLRGMEAVIGRIPVGTVWTSFGPHSTSASSDLMSVLEQHAIGQVEPQAGWVFRLPSGNIEVLGPRRRYASPNDQSIVLLVRLSGLVFLLSGDIETFAQTDLGSVGPDILKVPHQGGFTSDLGWIRENAGRFAVISVGPNDFGHPAPEIIAALEEAGARVVRTDLDGDVVVDAVDWFGPG